MRFLEDVLTSLAHGMLEVEAQCLMAAEFGVTVSVVVN